MKIHPLDRTFGAAGPILLAGVLALAGCGDSGNVIGPENQPEVSNVAGTFEWQVTDLSSVSQELTYTWTSTSSTVDVNQATSLSGGSATLRVLDADGAEVYAADLDQNGTFQTDAGAAGDWTVVVTLSDASGSLNFRLESP